MVIYIYFLTIYILTQSAPWAESSTGLSQTTYLTSSSENLYSSSNPLPSSSSSSSAVLTRKPQPPVDYSSVQHGNYAQELLKQSQNTKYLLGHGHDSSRKEGLTSANSSSVNLSDTSFSSGGSGQTASNMPQPGSSGDLYSRDRSRGKYLCSFIMLLHCISRCESKKGLSAS